LVLSLVSLVYQFARLVRVRPQLPKLAVFAYCAKVQLWPMYSDAIQIVEPSITAAP
jgi:hypothetical protein